MEWDPYQSNERLVSDPSHEPREGAVAELEPELYLDPVDPDSCHHERRVHTLPPTGSNAASMWLKTCGVTYDGWMVQWSRALSRGP